MTRLVDRFGRTGFAALTSLTWGLPMAAWAGSADLTPIDQTAYPWVALAIGLVMLAAWLVLLTRLSSIAVTPRPHRLEVKQMSSAEKKWMLVFGGFAIGAIAWLNAAATVDWTPLGHAIAAGQLGPIWFAVAAIAFLAAMLAGAWLSWRRAARAFAQRAAASSLSNVC